MVASQGPRNAEAGRALLETSSDRYVLLQYLAEGGMGAIYRGKKLGVGGFEKEVVLKQLLPEYTSDPKFIDLFLREARISASLDHANIVHTLDLVTAGSDYFIVMEYVRGGDLRTILRRSKRRDRRLGPQAGLYIGHAILDALSYAHRRQMADGQSLGLIHRDVSPSNILISGAGEVKLTDFGIAKAATQKSIFYRVKGKIGYMSPEQARGEPLDHRSDLYSLAVCLYECFVGERLFVADIISTPSMIYSQPVVPPSQRRNDLPRELDAVMQKSLALKPDDRFQTADEFQEALDRVAFRHGLTCSSSEIATHLVDACGEVATWTFTEQVEPQRQAGTALLDGDGDSDPDKKKGSRSRVTLGEGTQLTSLLGRMEKTGAPSDDEDDERDDEDDDEPVLSRGRGRIETGVVEARRAQEPTAIPSPTPPSPGESWQDLVPTHELAEPPPAPAPMPRHNAVHEVPTVILQPSSDGEATRPHPRSLAPIAPAPSFVDEKTRELQRAGTQREDESTVPRMATARPDPAATTPTPAPLPPLPLLERTGTAVLAPRRQTAPGPVITVAPIPKRGLGQAWRVASSRQRFFVFALVIAAILAGVVLGFVITGPDPDADDTPVTAPR